MVVNFRGRLNSVDVQLRDLEKLQNHRLLSRQFGLVVRTTTAGITDHEEARQKPRRKSPGILFLGM